MNNIELLSNEIVDRYSDALHRQDVWLTQGQLDILQELVGEALLRALRDAIKLK